MLTTLAVLSLTAAAQSPSGILLAPRGDADSPPPDVLVGEALHGDASPIFEVDLGNPGVVAITHEHEGVSGLSFGFPRLSESQVARVVVPGATCERTREDTVLHPPDPGRDELAFSVPADCHAEGVLTLRAELVDGLFWDLEIRALDASDEDIVSFADIVGFNPQPEPPALVGLNFGTPLLGGSIVEVTLRDAGGAIVSF